MWVARLLSMVVRIFWVVSIWMFMLSWMVVRMFWVDVAMVLRMTVRVF